MRRAILVLVMAACTFAAEGTADTDTDTDEGSSSSSSSSSSASSASSAIGTLSASSSGGSSTSSSSSSAEESSSSAEPSTSSSSSAESSSSTGELEPNPYVDCWPDHPSEECPQSCMLADGAGEPDALSACAPDCGKGCPSVGELDGVCLDDIAIGTVPPVCVLACGPGQCPIGMSCTELLDFVDGDGDHPTVCLW